MPTLELIWKKSYILYPPDITQSDAVIMLLDKMLASNPELVAKKSELFLILSELIANAIEYGLLDLDPQLKKNMETFDQFHQQRQQRLAALTAGWIRISIELFSGNRGKERLKLYVEDSGPNNAFGAWGCELSDNQCPSGRGLALVDSMCQKLLIEKIGTRVTAELNWNQHS